MSTTRLTFLYPHLFRTLRRTEPPCAAARQCRTSKARRAAFVTTPCKNQLFAPRHGKGVEPALEPGEVKDGTKVAGPETLQKSESPDGRKIDQPPVVEEPQPDLLSGAPLSNETEAAERIPGDIGSLWLSETEKEDKARERQSSDETGFTFDGQPLVDTVLHMEPPAESPIENFDLPHLPPSPYVHHFDSYTLTKRIEEGGFSPEQSIQSMEIVRALLAQNLDAAKEGLVSKSDVENETYLFQAACSELKTDVQNARSATDEKMRMQRTLLQHEVDILNLKLTQDLASLKDDLKGMFNDRKMDVRMEQRSMESAIQELDYKITVALNSDSKSEVEGVRWILTRRSVLAIVFMAVVVLSSLRLASYRSHEAAIAQQKAEKQAELDRQMSLQKRDSGNQTDEVLAMEGLSAS